jgi:hypothetical protein
MTIKDSLSSNIVGHWDFRKGTVADQTSNGNDGSFSGSPLWRNTSKGKSLEFQSTNIVTVSDSVELQATNMSVIIFGDFQDQTSGARFFSKRDAGGTHIDFFNFSASNLGVFDGTSTSDLAADITNVRMIGFTLTSGSAPEFFLNGVKEGNGDVTITISANDAPIAIGNFHTGNNPALNKFNEVLYFNTALTEQQMSELYNEWLQEAHLDTIPRATVLPEETEDIQSANLQGKWNMNVKGDTVFDVSGNGNDGTITHPLPSTAGIFGQALDFQGTTGEIEITDASTIQNIFDGGGSASFWCKPRSDGGVNRGHLFIKGSHNLSVRNEVAGFVKVLYEQVMSGTNGQWKTTGVEVALNTWNHVAFTYDADSASNDPIIYINGQSVPITEDLTPTGTRNTDVGDDLFIGNNTAETATFDGAIDQPQLWDTILTAAQVTQLYAQGQKKLDLNFTGEDWNVSVSNVTANFLENTGFEITSGTWQVDDSSAGKQITCVGTGIISTPSQQAFGTWEFELSKDAASNPLIGFIMDSVQAGNAALGYQMTVTVDEAIFLRRITGGGSTTIFSTATGAIATDEFVRVVITRDASGTFEIFVNETSIDTGGDTAYVDSSFLVLQLDNGDAIRNIKFWPTVRDPTA